MCDIPFFVQYLRILKKVNSNQQLRLALILNEIQLRRQTFGERFAGALHPVIGE